MSLIRNNNANTRILKCAIKVLAALKEFIRMLHASQKIISEYFWNIPISNNLMNFASLKCKQGNQREKRNKFWVLTKERRDNFLKTFGYIFNFSWCGGPQHIFKVYTPWKNFSDCKNIVKKLFYKDRIEMNKIQWISEHIEKIRWKDLVDNES